MPGANRRVLLLVLALVVGGSGVATAATAAEQLDEARAEIAKLRGEVDKANGQIDNLTEQLRAMKARNADLARQLAAVRERADETKKEADKACAELDRVLREVRAAMDKAKAVQGLRQSEVILPRHPQGKPSRREYELPKLPEGKPADGSSWLAFIRGTFAPGTWRGSGAARRADAPSPYSIQAAKGRLVVTHTKKVHQAIAAWFASHAKARNRQVHIMARLLKVDDAFVDSLKLKFRASAGLGRVPAFEKRLLAEAAGADATRRILLRALVRSDELLPRLALLSDDQRTTLLSSVLKGRKGTLIFGPRLTCFNTQRAQFLLPTSHNCIPRVSRGDGPEIGGVPSGVRLALRPFIGTDRKTIGLVIGEGQPMGLEGKPPGGAAAPRDRPTIRPGSGPTLVTIPNGGTLFVRYPTEADLLAAMRKHGIPSRAAPTPSATGRAVRSVCLMLTAEVIRDIFTEE